MKQIRVRVIHAILYRSQTQSSPPLLLLRLGRRIPSVRHKMFGNLSIRRMKNLFLIAPSVTTILKNPMKYMGKFLNTTCMKKNEKVSCTDCHFETIQGDGKVDKKSCYQCHPKIANNFNNASDMHYIHIDKHTVACTSCHGQIMHGWIKESNKVYGNDNSGSTKENYMIQKFAHDWTRWCRC